MFTLQKVNVVRIVATEKERDSLLDEGFDEVEEAEEEKTDLNSLSVDELKELAKQKDIEGISKMNKGELIAALEGGE